MVASAISSHVASARLSTNLRCRSVATSQVGESRECLAKSGTAGGAHASRRGRVAIERSIAIQGGCLQLNHDLRLQRALATEAVLLPR